MKPLLLSAALLLSFFASPAQDCDCPSGAPEGGQVMKTYTLGNGIRLGICGYSTVEADDTTYTKFVLFRCGEDRIIEQWTVNISCKLEQTKDALMVEEMYNLPVGQNFSTLWRPFYVHKYTFKAGSYTETEYYDKRLPKYNQAQIAEVIKQYKDLPETVSQQTLTIANMLFWATVSGSKEAEGYLKTIPDKFGPFGSPFNEEWNDVNTRYEQWVRNKK